MNTALIVVDVQVDFCQGGALAVEGGNEVASRIRKFAREYTDQYNEILFTADWHNAWPDTNGGHFSETPDYADSWPVHCESYTDGAEFHPQMWYLMNKIGTDIHEHIFRKGVGRPDYSGFQGKNNKGVYLGEYLEESFIGEVDVVGIAGDYCVRQTALDAVGRGYKVNLLADKIASVGGKEKTLEAVQEVDTVYQSMLE